MHRNIILLSHLEIQSCPWYSQYFKTFFSKILLSCLPLLSLTAASTQPPPPAISYLYTAYVQCTGNLMEPDGPHGLQKAIPIVDGNFTGPRLSGRPLYTILKSTLTGWLINWPTGKILDVGADWGTTDIRTSIFPADTRYSLQTNDGTNNFIWTEGPKPPSGQLHPRLIFEMGEWEVLPCE